MSLLRRRVQQFRRASLAVLLGMSAALAVSAAGYVYAEDAPVYDADNYPPQFDGQTDEGADVASAASSQPVAASRSDEARLARLERQLAALQSMRSIEKLDALQSDIQLLRGQLEQLTHQIQQIQAEQRLQLADLGQRLAGVQAEANAAKSTASEAMVEAEKKQVPVSTVSPDRSALVPSVPVHAKTVNAKPATIPSPHTSHAQPNVQEEQQTYQTAYDLIRAEKYDQAITTLQKMLDKYPSGQFAANAHYWLGELYGLQGRHSQSAAEFQTVIKHYPDSPRIADANLKLGLIYAAEQKWSQAKGIFKKIINQYPGTASARLAGEQLQQLKVAGH